MMNDEDKIFIQSLTDKEIVQGILERNNRITRLYLYETCKPLFWTCYTQYETDCESLLEFINAIYLYLMLPNVKTGKCYLEAFGFGCSLIWWISIVTKNYCHQLYRKKAKDNPNDIDLDEEILGAGDYRQLFQPRIDLISIDGSDFDDEDNNYSIDRFPVDTATLYMDGINEDDVAKVLQQMKSSVYRELIRHRYVEEMSNAETAKILGMTMRNYYNAHHRAKEQWEEALRKEGLL